MIINSKSWTKKNEMKWNKFTWKMPNNKLKTVKCAMCKLHEFCMRWMHNKYY